MSFSNESLRAKLDALQETQDSIVSTSTWVLFHYRYADRIASEWEKYLYTAPVHRKLPVIYLANDVVQQAKARKRVEFIDAFYKVLPQSLGNAYKKVSPPVQQRIVKLINVLRERKIFPKPIQVPGVELGVVPSVASTSGAGAGAVANGGSEDEKLKALASSGQRFHRFYHELLISANGTFTDAQLPYLQRLKLMLKENIGQLQDLESTVEDEIVKTGERSKAAKEKLEELKKIQEELEQQRRIEEAERLEKLRKEAEEDRILPTYAADSDDDKSSDDDESDESDDDDEDDVSDGDEEEESTAEQKENESVKERQSNESTNTEEEAITTDASPKEEEEAPKKPPKKKLRFA